MSALLMILAGALAAYVLIYYNVFRGSRCRSRATLKGKTAVVTGSNTGIGKATALDLARRGARVILACRNREKAEAAVYDVRRESGNTEVLFMHLDLASLKSVRTFAGTFLKSEPRLDLLINNAGLIGPGRTEDGFGLAFGVNHLGHFLLTLLLLDRLKASGHSRIVNVSALLHRLGSIDFSTLNTHKDLVTGQSTWHCFRAYCHSKLCNVLFTRELTSHLEGTSVTCYSLHPGVITTEFGRNMSLWLRLLLLPFSKLFFLDSDGGAQTTLHCALQEGLEPLSGRYFSSCGLQEVSAAGRDDALARKLWECPVKSLKRVTVADLEKLGIQRTSTIDLSELRPHMHYVLARAVRRHIDERRQVFALDALPSFWAQYLTTGLVHQLAITAWEGPD